MLQWEFSFKSKLFHPGFHSADLCLFFPLWKMCLQKKKKKSVQKGQTLPPPCWAGSCLSQPLLGSKLLTFFNLQRLYQEQ